MQQPASELAAQLQILQDKSFHFTAHDAIEGDSGSLCVQTFQEEFFYAWTYDRPMSPWTYLLSGVAVAVVMLCCLFPLAPYPVR